jgi:glycosyltransferase involved in cell wall biosynthesis
VTARKRRVAVVNSHPIQYFAPLYAYITANSDIEVTALYCSDFSLRDAVDPGFKTAVKWDVDLTSGYRVKFLGPAARSRTPGGFFSLICPQIWKEIRTGGYDAVWLHGYAYAAYVLAFLAASSRGVPVFMRSETHLGLARQPWRQALRDGLLSRWYRHVDAFLAIGSANREYYLALGAPAERVFHVPYSVDNARFEAAAEQGRAIRAQTRQRLGLHPSRPVVLFASKFMRRKRPDDVVDAVAQLQRDGFEVDLLMVGSGEMETALREQVARLDVRGVAFAGFVNQAELPAVYAACDVFVLPSTDEPWGLVVNEVMCAGLPVVVSSEIGCARDLVVDEHNGRQFPAGDTRALAQALHWVLSDPPRCARLGQHSRELIRRWGYAECAAGLSAAMGAAAG